MNLRIIVFLLLSTSLLLQISCKNRKSIIDNIHYQYSSSMRIPFNKIFIDIKYNNNKPLLHLKSFPMDDSPEWNYSKIDTSFSITSSQYKAVTGVIARMLENDNIIQDTISGKDGSRIILQFQVNGLNKNYKVWSPDYETKERKIVEFLEVNKIIAETANIKTKLVEK